MKIGVLVDQAAKDWASNWQERITAIVQASSVVYEKQMNVELEIKEFVHYDADCSAYYPNGDSGKIDEIGGMRRQLGDVQGNHRIPGTVTTHLFTGCDNDGW